MTDLVQIIRDLQARQPLVLVAIDGAGGAGKSTLAKALASQIEGASVVHGDGFYRPMDETERARLTPREGYERYFDWQRLKEQVLRPLRSGQAATYELYDWDRQRLGTETVTVQPGGIVIVEGVYTMRPQLRDSFDLWVFVETPRAERLRRARERAENSDAWINRWAAAEDWYLQHVEPSTSAHVVVAGTD